VEKELHQPKSAEVSEIIALGLQHRPGRCKTILHLFKFPIQDCWLIYWTTDVALAMILDKNTSIDK